ncbi:MAG TPA: FtsX-like permease family protein [Gemmataceae bacterium]|nr:FtsX-like permease family protein [Gemmataceae bacterium]
MFALYRTLSLRYLSRRWFRAALVVASIMLGVAILVATQALNETMAKATLASSNPIAGTIDLIVTNGDFPIDRSLTKEIEKVKGVKEVQAKIFDQAKIVLLDKKIPVMVMGFDLKSQTKKPGGFEEQFILSSRMDVIETAFKGIIAARIFGAADAIPGIIGQELEQDLAKESGVRALVGFRELKVEKSPPKTHTVYSVASMKPKEQGDMAAFGGYLIVLDLDDAATVLGIPEGKVRRIDVALDPGVDPKKARVDIERVLAGRAEVRTLEEQNQSLQSAMVGMKTGFSMCGVAALIVGMFLVYNALSVSVAERRHEIGILLALGATRDQVWRLFAGEAFFLGSLGALLGIPLGTGFAHLGLEPMQDAIGDIFTTMNQKQVTIGWDLIGLAIVVGILAAVIASMVPAVQAAYDKPAEAVRRVPKEPAVSHLLLHIAATGGLILGGMSLIFLRDYLPKRWGTYGGLSLVMIGALLSAPLFAQVAARCLAPFSRRFFPIEWRIAADNLVRAPGRTGMVIGALAAGVCLIVETAGIIRSNREAIIGWVDSSIGSDIVVTSGSPVGSGGQNLPMDEGLGDELKRQLSEIEDVIPIRICTEIPFGKDRVAILTTDAGRAHGLETKRVHKNEAADILLKMDGQKNAVVVSGNFAALHHVHTGDNITLGNAEFHVVGVVVDYTWNLGTVIMNRRDYVERWGDKSVTVFDVYLREGADAKAVKNKIAAKFTGHDLHALTREELKGHIESMIQKLYTIALGQEIVVVLVAALGVVTALLISVLQRRREMGLLRAIGASQAQVVYLVLAEACLMGIFGSILGVIFAMPLQWYTLQILFLEESGYVFPVYVPWWEGAAVALTALAIAALAGVGPALYAVRERIPEAIAYE